MRIEEYIGHRVRERREELDMTQEELGRKLGDLLGKPWPRQTVSTAERGARAFPAVELLALATVLRVPVHRLVTPTLREIEIDLPAARVLLRDDRVGPGGGLRARHAAVHLLTAFRRAQRDLDDAEKALRELDQVLDGTAEPVMPESSETSPREESGG